MSANNGVIRIGRKGIKKFAIGEGEPFDVDVVVTFQTWIGIDDEYRKDQADRAIPVAAMSDYHRSATKFVCEVSGTEVTAAEALDFLARLREQYDELADFFQPKKRTGQDSPDSSEVEYRFSAEGESSPTSTN